MQISCGIHPEVSQEKHLRVGEKRARADHPGFSPAERERGGGGVSDGRSCSHAVVDTTEVLGVRGKSAIAANPQVKVLPYQPSSLFGKFSQKFFACRLCPTINRKYKF